jgi:hypothetical protein
MANYDDDEDLDNLDNEPVAEEQVVENSGSNRNFLLAIGIIGGIFLLLLIGLVMFALLFLPRQREAREATNAVVLTQNVGTALFATEQAQLAAQPLTPSPSLTPTITQVEPTATFTSVMVVATNTPTVTFTSQATVEDARTATVAALLTQAAAGKTGTVESTTGAGGGAGGVTQVAPGTPGAGGTPGATATGLPQSGFADEVGLPGLLALSAGLVVVIFLARKLRLSPK